MAHDLEKVYCRFCNLSIGKQTYKRLPRPAVVGTVLSFNYWHSRWKGDCWDKAVAQAKARKETQMTLPFVKEGVILQ